MKTKNNLMTALLTAALCVIAPVAVPLGPIPVTLATLGVYLAAGLLGPLRGSGAVGLYLVLGAVGVPVFAGFTGGLQQLTGVTGGFLWGYLLCALVAGVLCRLWRHPALVPVALACGTAVLYALGCGWYAWQAEVTLGSALWLCLPSLPGEIVKIAVATGLILSLRGRVSRLLTEGMDQKEGSV